MAVGLACMKVEFDNPRTQRFGSKRNMESDPIEKQLSTIAGAIAEPARARMLCSLLDGCARTATELAMLADISASTASAHLARLRDSGLVESTAQGKHRYFRLMRQEVATALEALLVVAGVPRQTFKPNTPSALRQARTCYDHMAGARAVELHDAMQAHGWLVRNSEDADNAYSLSPKGEHALAGMGLDLAAARAKRRRFACACMDWSERRPHLGGSLGAAVLAWAEHRSWVIRATDSRALSLTPAGERAWLRLTAGRA
jgi:DNA-binding transcriptional ArsR family regulator